MVLAAGPLDHEQEQRPGIFVFALYAVEIITLSDSRIGRTLGVGAACAGGQCRCGDGSEAWLYHQSCWFSAIVFYSLVFVLFNLNHSYEDSLSCALFLS